MVQELALGAFAVRSRLLPIPPARPFARRLTEEYPALERDFARIAVSLEGARKRLVQRGANPTIAGGDILEAPALGGNYASGT